MEKTPFFKTDCPSCGAPVEAYSATVVTLVCGHCRSMLVAGSGKGRSGYFVANSGRDSALLEDFSPLQIGTRGVFDDRKFTLIGRLQVHYDVGAWNEWYVLFDDGQTGWLSEVGDLYAMTCLLAQKRRRGPKNFKSVKAGSSSLIFNGQTFIASDVRTIHYRNTDAQGELPFNLSGSQATGEVCDWRRGNLFLTLDYSTFPMDSYFGRIVSLDSLKLENKRSDDEIRESAGRLKGEILSENCPHCGFPVHWPSGVTSFLLCQSCGSSLNTTKDTVALMEANAQRKEQENLFTLSIGTKGRLNDTEYLIIGAVRFAEIPSYNQNQSEYWTEYLLYNTQQGFAWLIESGKRWRLSETLHTWPDFDSSGNPAGEMLIDHYRGQVEAAAGAFYWKVKQGDLLHYKEYSGKKSYGRNVILCSEQSKDEIVWSKSSPVSYRQMRKAFGLSFDTKEMLSYWLKGDNRNVGSRDNVARIIAMLILIIVNLPAWLSPHLRNPVGIAVSLCALVWIWVSDRYKNDRNYEEERVGTIIFFAFIIFLTVLFNYVQAEDSDSSHSGSSGSYHGYSAGHK
ncbi:TPA: DUF4178 domain-containing protein [Neisseria subflava]